MRLPTGLSPWTESLSHLTPDLALALGPLVRGVDRLVSSQDRARPGPGGLDGFEGVTTHGHPELMLVSEWLLADEAPDEFLRRAAHRELLHLAPAVRTPAARGRVAVLADTGPGQAGAGRLVQLACMIVLHRRAATLGTTLAVGILGREPGDWHTGDLPELLKTWLDGRGDAEPDSGDVAAWTHDVADGDDVWILTGPRLSSKLHGRRRVVSSRESAWGEHGATHVRVTCDGDGAELALPPGPIAVRALRGAEFRREPAAAGNPEVPGALRFPIFPSSARRILARGTTSAELVSIHVPRTPGRGPVRRRLHRLEGPVLAASILGKRIVALIESDHRLRVQTIGQPLGRVASMSVPVEAAGLDMAGVHQICAEGLVPLHYQSGDVIFPLRDRRWWRLTRDRGALQTDLVAVGPATGDQFDQPHHVTHGPDGKHVSIPRISGPIEPQDDTVILGGGGYARSGDAVTWQVVHPRNPRTIITIQPRSHVLGLVFDGQEPVLVTSGPGGVLLRLVRRSGTVTLTDWSGLPAPPVVHPTLPLIAALDDTGRLKAGDLVTGQILLHTAADA
ncbi:hypothetical protein GCM10023194_70080 [Planotetraspora phitsanulokensis]|uniref:Uncharacterized protein n=1 Tax=Planotetraspora phitsanulokensis TaxID=575192 RepID=A0A8J3U219_9ACTN|nr:hypothetical protein [Planotetraspora phitsanulokensis]GII36790.1 hypothetical protein Pph01_17930 [Planotetraspora phitsanulokensis]